MAAGGKKRLSGLFDGSQVHLEVELERLVQQLLHLMELMGQHLLLHLYKETMDMFLYIQDMVEQVVVELDMVQDITMVH